MVLLVLGKSRGIVTLRCTCQLALRAYVSCLLEKLDSHNRPELAQLQETLHRRLRASQTEPATRTRLGRGRNTKKKKDDLLQQQTSKKSASAVPEVLRSPVLLKPSYERPRARLSTFLSPLTFSVACSSASPCPDAEGREHF